MHLKRSNVSKFWPIPRKGTKYVAVPTHNKKEAVPLITIIRDVLRLVRTKKELRRVLNEKQILINNKIIKETNSPVCLFDVISIPAMKKNYRAMLSEKKRMILEEISEKDAETRIYRVMGKKVLSKKKIQLG